MISDRNAKIDKLITRAANTNQLTYETRVSSVPVNIQPVSDELVAFYDGIIGMTFRMFAPVTASGITVSDHLKIIDGYGRDQYYTVKGRKDWNMPPLPHYEFILFKTSQQLTDELRGLETESDILITTEDQVVIEGQ